MASMAATTSDAGATGAVDPFASFMAQRKSPTRQDAKWSSHPAQATWQTVNSSMLQADSSVATGAAANPFATFLSLRPEKKQIGPMTSTEQSLREDVLRTKRQLLEVALISEIKALDPDCPQETAAALRRLRRGQKYLRRPELTLDALSGASTPVEEAEAAQSALLPKGSTTNAATSSRSRIKSEEVQRVSPEELPGLSKDNATRQVAEVVGSRKGMQQSASAPQLLAEADSRTSSRQSGRANSRGSKRGDNEVTLPAIGGLPKVEQDPLVSGWWTTTRTWNAGFSTKGSRTCLKIRRNMPWMPGGCVVLGNGRLPLFSGSHMLSTGYWFSFQVDQVDDANFPSIDGEKVMSLGLGVSRLPARDKRCERRAYAYEIPDAVVVGYGGQLVDGGKWFKAPWDPKNLEAGDIVGLLVTGEGDVVIFVNGLQVLRVPTSLAKTGEGENCKQTLFPVVDLNGRVESVSLLTRGKPPNQPLEARNRLT